MRPQRAYRAAAVMENHFHALVESPSPNCNHGIIAYYRTADIFVSMWLLRFVLAEQTHIFPSFPLCKWVHLFRRTKNVSTQAYAEGSIFVLTLLLYLAPSPMDKSQLRLPPTFLPRFSVSPSIRAVFPGWLCLHMNEPEFHSFC